VALTRTDLENDLLRATFFAGSIRRCRCSPTRSRKPSLTEVLDGTRRGAPYGCSAIRLARLEPDRPLRGAARSAACTASPQLLPVVARQPRLAAKARLVLGLDSGGSCRGVTYRIAAHTAADELRLLWRREMVLGAYAPRWAKVDSAGKRCGQWLCRQPLAPQLRRKLPFETSIKTLVSARGRWARRRIPARDGARIDRNTACAILTCSSFASAARRSPELAATNAR